MPIFLTNEQQAACITAREAVDVMAEGCKQFSLGDAIRRPRIDNYLPTSRTSERFCFSSMEGGIRSGYYALRIKPDILSWPVVNGLRRRISYCVKPGLYGGLVFLFSTENAELLAIMNDGYIQHVRVAATAALGVRYLARPDASIIGMFGSGGMAHHFAECLNEVMAVHQLQVFSPNSSNLQSYCTEMEKKLGYEFIPNKSPESVAKNADVLCLCTNSQDPVVDAGWIKPGTHLTNVRTTELSDELCAKIEIAGLLTRRTPPSVVNFIDDDFDIRGDAMAYVGGRPEERAKIPRGVPTKNRYPNAKYVDCCDWKTGKPYKRDRRGEITILATNSMGIHEGDAGASAGNQGVQFATVAGRIYENARKLEIGQNLPLEMFLQDIPT
jgi:ornithine cyclodeaminase/alanine dehydrogenase-like protein (mu-crystallin family)